MSSEHPAAPHLLVDPEHPYLGLASFEEAHRAWFHGRGAEREELIRLVRRDLLTVLFGHSGLGKTSLLNAGLFPWLRENRFLPIRIRLDYRADAPDLTEQVRLAVADVIREHGIDAPAPTNADTLWEYFHRTPFWDARSRLLTPVLVLDQFEEIFTLGADEPCREAFLDELADLGENRVPASVVRILETSEEGLPFASDHPKLKLILSLREDFLAHLEDLRPRMPAVARNRFRLVPMNGEQAFAAVCRPGGDLLTARTAARIVRVVGSGQRRGRHLQDLSVEPALLSLVCRELNNRRLAKGATAITPDLLQAGQREILADFYRRSIAGLGSGVQRLIEDHLLTTSGFRGTKSLDDALALDGVTEAAVRTLVDGRLLRQEERLGTPHLELIHDVLAPVVRQSRDRRRADEAADKARRRAEEAAAEAERQAEEAAAEARRRAAAARKRFRWWVGGLGAAAVAALLFGLFIWAQSQVTQEALQRAEFLAVRTQQALRQARDQKQLALAGLLAAKSGQNRERSPPLALLLGVEAVKADPVPAALEALHDAVQFTGGEPLVGHTGSVFSVAWDPGGGRLASAGADGRVRLWNLAQPQADPQVLRGHAGPVNSVAWDSAGGRLASADDDGTVRAWDLARPQAEPQVLRGHEGPVSSVAWDPGGDRLASAGQDRTVRVWEAPLPETEPLVLRGHEQTVSSVAWDPRGSRLATTDEDGAVRVWDLSRPEAEHKVLREKGDSVWSVAWDPGGGRVATAGEDGTVRVWDLSWPDAVPKVLRGHGGSVWSVAWDPGGGRVASASIDETVRLWDLSEPQAEPQVLVRSVTWGTAVAWDRTGRRLASADYDGTVRVWDMGRPQAEPQVLRGHQGPVSSVAWEPGGDQLAGASSDGMRVWDLSRPEAEPLRIPVNDRRVTALAWDPGGGQLAGASIGGIRVWDLSRPEAEPLLLRGGKSWSQANAVAWDAEDGRVAIAGEDGAVRVWDLSQPEAKPQVLRGHKGSVTSVAWDPGTGRLASAGADKTVRLWDLSRPKDAPRVLRGHEGTVSSLVWAPGAGHLASASDDRTVRVWDLSRLEAEPQVLRGHQGSVTSMAWDPGATRLASTSTDGTLQMWNMAPDYLVPIACRRAGRNLTWEEYERYLEENMPLRTCKQWPIHPSVIEEAERLVGDDRTEAAVTLLKRAKEEQPELALNPANHVRRVALSYRVERLVDTRDQGQDHDLAQAFTDLKELSNAEPDLELKADVWAGLCLFGAVWGRAEDAMGPCARALAPDTALGLDMVAGARLGRGLAAAQQGDLQAAIPDLERVQAYLVEENEEPELRAILSDWIKALKAGRNPINAATLADLRKRL